MSDKRENKHSLIKKRVEALIKKAEGGDEYSMRVLATIYSNGEYFPKDYIAAQAWLRKAAELGSEIAKKQLAKLLTEGNGVAQNYEEAFDINHELMLDCDIDAMAEVGIAYKLGRGIEQDEEKGSFYMDQAFELEMDLMEEEKKKKTKK